MGKHRFLGFLAAVQPGKHRFLAWPSAPWWSSSDGFAEALHVPCHEAEDDPPSLSLCVCVYTCGSRWWAHFGLIFDQCTRVKALTYVNPSSSPVLQEDAHPKHL